MKSYHYYTIIHFSSHNSFTTTDLDPNIGSTMERRHWSRQEGKVRGATFWEEFLKMQVTEHKLYWVLLRGTDTQN